MKGLDWSLTWEKSPALSISLPSATAAERAHCFFFCSQLTASSPVGVVAIVIAIVIVNLVVNVLPAAVAPQRRHKPTKQFSKFLKNERRVLISTPVLGVAISEAVSMRVSNSSIVRKEREKSKRKGSASEAHFTCSGRHSSPARSAPQPCSSVHLSVWHEHRSVGPAKEGGSRESRGRGRRPAVHRQESLLLRFELQLEESHLFLDLEDSIQRGIASLLVILIPVIFDH